MTIDFTRRRFLFSLAAVPLEIPAVKHFVLPKWDLEPDIRGAAGLARAMGMPFSGDISSFTAWGDSLTFGPDYSRPEVSLAMRMSRAAYANTVTYRVLGFDRPSFAGSSWALLTKPLASEYAAPSPRSATAPTRRR